MHVLFFGLKRAFQSTLRITRKPLKTIGLTAARFDLLFALRGAYQGRTRQSRLRRALGVAASTVSRMVKSLKELGLVRREVDEYDRRQRIVSLTPEGWRSIRRGCDDFIHSGWAQLAVTTALAGDTWYWLDEILVRTDDFDGLLNQVRSAFRDHATLYYRWHPDD